MKSSSRRAALSQRVERALDLPTGALTEAPRIELSGNRRALVEGCQSILEYDEDRIRLRTAAGIVRFLGRDLCMNCLNPSCAVITGQLLSVEFL